MVYAGAAKKTASFMVIALVLSLGIIIFTTNDQTPTGRVTSTGAATGVESSAWVVFLLGVLVGAIVIGTMAYFMRLDAKRKE